MIDGSAVNRKSPAAMGMEGPALFALRIDPGIRCIQYNRARFQQLKRFIQWKFFHCGHPSPFLNKRDILMEEHTPENIIFQGSRGSPFR
jgi:hypothetical protein